MEAYEIKHCKDYQELIEEETKKKSLKEIGEIFDFWTYELRIENGTFEESRLKSSKEINALPSEVKRHLEWLIKNN